MMGFDELFRDAERLLGASFVSDHALPLLWSTSPSFSVPADVRETADAIQVVLDLPGHDPNRLEVKVDGDTLTVHSERTQDEVKASGELVRSERSYGTFARSFVLPNTVDPQKCDAHFEHGVLTITLAKREEAKPRSISVKVTS